jgi:hypothetical protein
MRSENLLGSYRGCEALGETADSHPLYSYIVPLHFVNGQGKVRSLMLTILSSRCIPSNALDSHSDCQKVYVVASVSQETLQARRQFADRFVGEMESSATKDCCYESKTSSQKE